MSNIWEDSRFANLIRDSRFKNLPNHKKQTKIDTRFKPMFNEAKFKTNQNFDKYGRKLRESQTDDLKKFYDIDSDDSEAEAEKEKALEEKKIKEEDEEQQKDFSGDELSTDGIVLPKKVKKKLLADVDFARGEGKILTDSSSDDDSSEGEEEVIEHEFWGEIDPDVQETEESTKRLAFCNMDWDQVQASDIMVLCHSFLPPGGAIINVKILVSDFGKKCLKEEERNGPLEILKLENQRKESALKLEISENDDSENEGESYHMESLRKYQVNKLKYYYAVVECDSKQTAEKLYQDCDGLEYESTSTKLDLRFIPDDMEFDEKDVKEESTDMPSNMDNYKPYLAPVTALQQVKVRVTWDENAIERKEIFEKLSSGKMSDIPAEQLKKFINCSEDEEDDDHSGSDENAENFELDMKNDPADKPDKDGISKYKLLLKDIEDKEKQKSKNKYEMEYTWGIDTALGKKKDTALGKKKQDKKENTKKISDDNGYSSDDIPSDIDLNNPYFAEELGNCELKSKKKSKKKKKEQYEKDDEQNNELKLLLNDFNDAGETNDVRESKKKRRKAKKDLANAKKSKLNEEENKNQDNNFQVDVRDKRFEHIFTSTNYSIDPNNPRFKKTAGMETIIQEKVKRRNENEKL